MTIGLLLHKGQNKARHKPPGPDRADVRAPDLAWLG